VARKLRTGAARLRLQAVRRADASVTRS
jgi:hypothetical protein